MPSPTQGRAPHLPDPKETDIYPARFRYEAPRSIEEAQGLLADDGGEAKVLAGGQSLIPVLKTRFLHPLMLVDINGLDELDYHRRDDDGTIRVGALCRHATLERSLMLAEHQPTMAAAAPVIADPLVRNRGTLVGSLCHADPQGDWAAVMTALDATVVAAGPRGRRSIPIADFVTGPFQNSLGHDELAVEAIVPAPPGVPTGGYLKLERRVGDFATVGVAVFVVHAGDAVAKAGIALTGVGGSTIAADEAARVLLGGPLTAEVIDEAAGLAAQAAQPRSDHRGSASYKRNLVQVFTKRILTGVARSGEEAA